MGNGKSSGRTGNDKNPAAAIGSASASSRSNPNDTRKLQEAQLSRATAQLRDLGKNRDTLVAMGLNPEQYGKALAKRQADLAQILSKAAPVQVKNISPHLASLLDRIGDILNPWQKILAPPATVGLVQTPSGIDPEEESVSAVIYQGDLAVGGNISGNAQESWWVNTWHYVVPLPAFEGSGSISYRFISGGAFDFYRQDVASASMYMYTTVFTTPDMVNHPINFNGTPASSVFGINATLPVSNVPPFVYGSSTITGTIGIVPGATPAVGILVGLIFGIQNGIVEFFPGETGSMTLTYPGATMPSDLGYIQYRRDQSLLVSAISEVAE
jgi:hypothetical protein